MVHLFKNTTKVLKRYGSGNPLHYNTIAEALGSSGVINLPHEKRRTVLSYTTWYKNQQCDDN